MTRRVDFIVHPGFELLDLSGPCSAFHIATEMHGADYAVRVVSSAGGPVRDRAGVVIDTMRPQAVDPDTTVLAVGGPRAPEQATDTAFSDTFGPILRSAERVGSVCTGAFMLAAAGMLDHRWATTHWRYVARLQHMCPSVRLDADRIFVRDGHVWTSAGMTAGMDLALALIEADLGPAVAAGVARDMVVHHRRPGGQSQFSALLDMVPSSGRVHQALCYARDHLGETLSTERLADAACVSARQLARLFVEATGTTPAKAIERLRVDAARVRIEEAPDAFATIAREVGFGDIERMRRACVATFGRSPQELRRLARAHRCSLRADPEDARTGSALTTPSAGPRGANRAPVRR